MIEFIVVLLIIYFVSKGFIIKKGVKILGSEAPWELISKHIQIKIVMYWGMGLISMIYLLIRLVG